MNLWAELDQVIQISKVIHNSHVYPGRICTEISSLLLSGTCNSNTDTLKRELKASSSALLCIHKGAEVSVAVRRWWGFSCLTGDPFKVHPAVKGQHNRLIQSKTINLVLLCNQHDLILHIFSYSKHNSKWMQWSLVYLVYVGYLSLYRDVIAL